MEWVQTIGAALAAGAAAGLQSTASQAIKDAYAALRNLLQNRLPSVRPAVQQLEAAPESQARRAVVEEDLARADVAEHPEITEAVLNLIACLEQHAPQEAERIGVDLQGLKASALRIAEIRAADTGVRIRDTEIEGDVEISGVQAGLRGDRDPNG